MRFTKTLPVILRAVWIAAFIISSIWFLYWICYDVYVWNKVMSQVSPQNYFGLILSIVLIILGTQLGKLGISEKLMLLTESVQKKLTKKTKQVQQVQPVLEEEQIQPSEQVQQIQPVKEEETQIPQGSSIPPGCGFYLGYLHNRPKSLEIPDKCLECEYVVDCLSPTARTIEERASNP